MYRCSSTAAHGSSHGICRRLPRKAGREAASSRPQLGHVFHQATTKHLTLSGSVAWAGPIRLQALCRSPKPGLRCAASACAALLILWATTWATSSALRCYSAHCSLHPNCLAAVQRRARPRKTRQRHKAPSSDALRRGMTLRRAGGRGVPPSLGGAPQAGPFLARRLLLAPRPSSCLQTCLETSSRRCAARAWCRVAPLRRRHRPAPGGHLRLRSRLPQLDCRTRFARAAVVALRHAAAAARSVYTKQPISLFSTDH